ncbi:MAG: hypothetical protein HN534_04915 [Euryarchaeota archaeon]|jgi:hypothetical protein|nr:hypothetical protein [Euryarchaeota archaeon]MBT3654251.1 hypothetical protein [Euryarchaeota archaeon]MBT3758063.1 hypothetical protein [Euryarchaeota archaeon]MBT4050312.1 hypothetical protein [Euryarchaeota archaeon]MBT4346608.1 hypothetical protein [Euryarchaeota archaeon]
MSQKINSRFLLIPPVLLAIFLAVSPIMILGDGGEQSLVTRDDLSESQIETLISMELARTPADYRAGKIALFDAIQLDDGSLIVAGSWEGDELIQNYSMSSVGHRDIFFSLLSVNGSFSKPRVAGSSGEDLVRGISIVGENIVILGEINGKSSFGEFVVDNEGVWSSTPFEAHLDYNSRKIGNWTGAWQIDEELLPNNSNNLWCGF